MVPADALNSLASSDPSQGLVRLGLGLSNQRSQLVLRLVPRAARLRELELGERELLPQPQQLRVQRLQPYESEAVTYRRYTRR
jgi:hypothetical protein